VAAIFAQVSRNSMCACSFTNQRRFDRARFAGFASAVTRFSQRGDVINIDTEF
jgi:hypothetical protein